MGRKSLEERMEKIFQILEKTYYRKHTTDILAGRCGPKVQKSYGRKLRFSLLELFKRGGGDICEKNKCLFIGEAE